MTHPQLFTQDFTQILQTVLFLTLEAQDWFKTNIIDLFCYCICRWSFVIIFQVLKLLPVLILHKVLIKDLSVPSSLDLSYSNTRSYRTISIECVYLFTLGITLDFNSRDSFRQLYLLRKSVTV